MATPTANTPTSVRQGVASAPPILQTQFCQTDEFEHSRDYTPQWDRDTDTLAGFLTWKSATHHNENVKSTITALLGPICQFVRDELRHQLSTHSSKVKIPDIQNMRERNKEMQDEIRHLTETVTKLTEQVAILSARPVPTATSTIVKTVTRPPPRQTPPNPMTPIQPSTPTYAQVVQKKPGELIKVKSKKMKPKKTTILPKPYPTAD
jgi:hypothetical protein